MLAIAAAVFLQAPFAHEPFSSYKKLHYQGFTVYASKAARAHPETLEPALKLLDEELEEVVRLVPQHALARLRTVPFFIENNNPDFPCACYHSSAAWLAEQGYILAKTHSVEIANPKNFVDWIKLNQPLMVLHELAHAYHDLTYSFEDRYIGAVYRYANVSGVYDAVAHNRGGKRRHYGLNNQQEYFAEATEAYFGQNDYFPFTRDQLRTVDPRGYEMVERCWRIGKFGP